MSLRARIFLVGLCVIAAMGAVFGAAAGAALIRPPRVGAALGRLSGAIDFASMAALIGGAETFLPRTRLGIALARAPFLAVFGVKVTMFFLVLHQLRLLVGASTLRDIVLGRYHRARTEERFFLLPIAVDPFAAGPALDALRASIGDSEFGYRMQALFAYVIASLGARIEEFNAQGHPDIRASWEGKTVLIQVKTSLHRHPVHRYTLTPEDLGASLRNPALKWGTWRC